MLEDFAGTFTRQKPQLGEDGGCLLGGRRPYLSSVSILRRPGQWLRCKRRTERCHVP